MEPTSMPAIITKVDKTDTSSGNTDSASPILGAGAYDGEASVFKAARSGSGACHASQRHIKTEQKRRDRINEGFTALQQLLPGKERVEKAVMLTHAADYIRQMQGIMQQVLACGAAKSLPNELQWNLRMLLPRKTDMLASSDHAANPAPVANNIGNNQAPAVTAPVIQVQEIARPVATAPVVSVPQYGLNLSEPMAQRAPELPSVGTHLTQGHVVGSEPAAGGAAGGTSGGMLMADPHTLSQLQALIQQQQAAQGWQNASTLLQALQMQQQLQQQAAASNRMGITPQMLQQLAAVQAPGIQALFQPPAPSAMSVGLPVTSHGVPGMSHGMNPAVSGPTLPTQVSPMPPQAPTAPLMGFSQALSQAPAPTSSFTPAATSAFSSLTFPTSTSAFTAPTSSPLSGLHQLMEAANASDEEKDGRFDTRSAKRARCYAAGLPRVAKAGILV